MHLPIHGNVDDVPLSTAMYGEVDQNMSHCSNLLLLDPDSQDKATPASFPFRLARRSSNLSRACTKKRCPSLLDLTGIKFVKHSVSSVLEASLRSLRLTIGRCSVARDLDLKRSCVMILESFKTGRTILSFVPIAKSCRSRKCEMTQGVKRILINRSPQIARRIGGI